MVRGPRLDFKPWEAAGAILALVAGYHFLAIRVRAGGIPAGDEGSWLSVASELARGHGFTTRWLEAHFLEPYTLPRPDDFRYPALTSLLAVVFRIFGFSVEAGRWTVTAVFLGFSATLWLVCRSAFGRWAGLAALWLTTASLLQLEWNSAVYTEGLFGWVAVGLAAWCLRGEPPQDEGKAVASSAPSRGLHKPAWWAVLGAGVAFLYLVRANGILFLPGILVLWWTNRRTVSWKLPALALACFALVAGPWLIRSAVHFGSPVHIAGNAGMLREVGQPHTYTLAEYLSHYDAIFPLKRMVLGVLRFFRTLHFYEHGLEMVPLLLAIPAAFLRIRFFNPFLLSGFLLTFLASSYAAYNSWAGVRYMSGLMPLVYAYGLSVLPALAARNPRLLPPPAAALAGGMGLLLLLLPVLGPHRFYERKYARPASVLDAPLTDHLSRLQRALPPGGRYYAGSLCKVNFLMEGRDCVGLQELYDSTWFTRSFRAFAPALIAFTHEETADSVMRQALDLMHERGYTQDTLDSGPLAVYLSLRPPVPAADSAALTAPASGAPADSAP